MMMSTIKDQEFVRVKQGKYILDGTFFVDVICNKISFGGVVREKPIDLETVKAVDGGYKITYLLSGQEEEGTLRPVLVK